MDQSQSTNQPPSRLWPSWTKILQVVLGLSVLFFFLKWINIWDSFQYLKEIHLLPFVVTCILGVVGTTVRGLRFYVLAGAVEASVTLIQSIISNHIASLLAIITPARTGEGSKVLFFSNKKKLAACFAFEKLADFGLLFLAGIYGMSVFRKYANALVVLAVIIVAGVVFLLNIERVLNFVLRREAFKERWLLASAREIPVNSWVVFTICTVIIWLLGVLAQVVCARALDLVISVPLMIQVSALTVIAGALSGTPGGIGTSQFVFTTLLGENLGADRQLIGVLSILLLLAAYITTLVQGSVGLVMHRILSSNTIRASA